MTYIRVYGCVMDIAIFLRIAFFVCLPSSVTTGALPALCLSRIIIGVQSLFARSWWTRRDGIFCGIYLKKSPQLPVVGSIFFRQEPNIPFSPVVPAGKRANKLQTAIIRIKKISPYDTLYYARIWNFGKKEKHWKSSDFSALRRFAILSCDPGEIYPKRGQVYCLSTL